VEDYGPSGGGGIGCLGGDAAQHDLISQGAGKRLRQRGPRSDAARDTRLLSSRNRHLQGEASALFQDQQFHILSYNVQGLLSHQAELSAVIRMTTPSPSLICLNETFLDASVEDVLLEGYIIVARRDRDDGRKCGGVAVYASSALANQITLVEKSASSERVWLIVHADTGPYLIGVWYRPPQPGETESIDSFEKEWEVHSQEALGTILVGDLNIHHLRWLRFSSRNSVEGEALSSICNRVGLRQLVRQPTRGNYLLDLALTDLDDVKCTVVGKIADHKGLALVLPLVVPRVKVQHRQVWQFKDACWGGLQDELAQTDWSWISRMDAHDGAKQLTTFILDLAVKYIPKRELHERKCTHPWMNEKVIQQVKAKRAAEGTAREAECRASCSACIIQEYYRYICRQRQHLQKLPRGVKGWWSKSRSLMMKKTTISSIPALKDSKGQWILESRQKANLFAETFSKKYVLAPEVVNEYTPLQRTNGPQQTNLYELKEKDAEDVLTKLRADSGTGPDLLPARILKICAKVLARPVLLLTMCILSTGVWPDIWIQHWVTPLYKKKSIFEPGNYRGIHLTAQLSKAVERLIKMLYQPYLSKVSAFGPRQFAYTAGCGARDALALLVLTWLQALAAGQKIAVYCSDVSGAFDRVCMERLVAKLRQKGLHPKVVAVLASWLRQRLANIVVGGDASMDMPLINMVFQGTVSGPTLWNLFFEDARHAINEWFFTEVVFADDLNAYRVFPSHVANEMIEGILKSCQGELHRWGQANQVAFDAAKESRHIVSLNAPLGDNFRLLGVDFDLGLTMSDAVSEIVEAAAWKLRTLLRTKRFYTDSDLITLYKAHLLSFLEYRTPAVYHATKEVLKRLDAVQSKFLKDIGVDEVTALIQFRLAPLSSRRDMAMLGLIHRAVLGKGPPQFAEHFKRVGGSNLLYDVRKDNKSPMIKRSAFGLVAIYNMLPSKVAHTTSVSAFQKGLQDIMRECAEGDHPNWAELYSPRLQLATHPLYTL